jgi:hypothetical protein
MRRESSPAADRPVNQGPFAAGIAASKPSRLIRQFHAGFATKGSDSASTTSRFVRMSREFGG